MENKLDVFNELVLLKYQIFNSIFLTLGLDGVHRTGILLPLLSEHCKREFLEETPPDKIIEGFFDEYDGFNSDTKRTDQLFSFIQYVERQIVLVDALEDAAFDKVHQMEGSGSFRSFYQTATNRNSSAKLLEALEYFRVRLVLTAHPTQFYPGPVLGIITDLAEAIKANDLQAIKQCLAQLGKTPFFKKEKPSPYDEAVSLTWYLENVFYQAMPEIFNAVSKQIGPKAEKVFKDNTLLQMGFWPGGDRDGNPFVDTDTTLEVAHRLRTSLMKSYYRDIRKLKRKITFRGSAELITDIESKLYKASFLTPKNPPFRLSWLKNRLYELKTSLLADHNGLYAEELENLIQKVKIFGFYFSTIDIRQDSRVIKKTFANLKNSIPKSQAKKLDGDLSNLLSAEALKKPVELKKAVEDDTMQSFGAMKTIQQRNGELGCYRYIISNCRDEFDVGRVFAMAKMMGVGKKMYLDVIPLFETIDDLRVAGEVMDRLYSNPIYMKHLKQRQRKQVIMLGFSDGTKDGGYITANWSIFKAKEDLSAVSRKHGISTVFFDGRGGPPARGGGNTNKFYASLGPSIESRQIQLTIQGQTISSNFGTVKSARYNMEQLLTAGLENEVLSDPDKMLNDDERKLFERLSEVSYKTYQDFKDHPKFVPYLEEMSTLKYYGKTNIGSRPSKRGNSDKLKFDDLRAIPFVGAWSQLKQNVPGFYGLGTACQKLDKEGRLNELKALYENSLFFRTLLENSMQSLSKSYFELTRYMKSNKEFGAFWELIYKESQLAKKYLLEISGQEELLETNPDIKASIKLREEIVLPLLTIQQYALMKIKTLEEAGKGKTKRAETLRNLVVRSLYGNINASRNSA
jgi:phosphoenolpyruvate carboxylase